MKVLGYSFFSFHSLDMRLDPCICTWDKIINNNYTLTTHFVDEGGGDTSLTTTTCPTNAVNYIIYQNESMIAWKSGHNSAHSP